MKFGVFYNQGMRREQLVPFGSSNEGFIHERVAKNKNHMNSN